MYGTASSGNLHGCGLRSYWVTTSTVTAGTTEVVLSHPFTEAEYEDYVRAEKLRKAIAHVEALRASRELSLDRRSGRRKPRPPGPFPASVSHDFHWMSQRKRCFRMRPPIPKYDRA